jgi:hypothetical protein
MTEQENKEIMNLADMIKGEVNRMCVTNSLEELDSMAQHARTNIENLGIMIYRAKFEEGGKE